MLDQQKISMGRVRQAYGLNSDEVERIIHALWPNNVFPVELWRRAHEKYWRAFADANQATYDIESPVLPEVDTTQKFLHAHLYSTDVMDFFKKLSRNIKARTLREGLKYILEETYEDIGTIFPEERDFLFSTLSRLEAVGVSDQYSPDSELFEEKILSLPISSYHFISHIFYDTVLVDKVAVIRHLRNYPLVQEVKGITRALVDFILKSSSPEMASASEMPVPRAKPTPEEQSQDGKRVFQVPADLWKEKSDPAVRDAMAAAGYPLEIIAYVLLNWCGINEVQAIHKTPQGRKTHVGRLISGKEYKDPKSFRNFLDPFLEKADSYIILKV